MNCSYCKYILIDEDRVCPNCGAPIEYKNAPIKNNFIKFNTLIEVKGYWDSYALYPSSFIPVVSVIRGWRLVLSTGKYASNTVYVFDEFGQTKYIEKNEVLKILEYNKRFSEKPYFIVMDRRIVGEAGLYLRYKCFFENGALLEW